MIAAWEGAVIRSLVGVDPQVVEKVMPLSKDFLAVSMSASKKSYDPSVIWVLVFIDHEFVGSWDVLVDSDLVQVELSSFEDLDEMIVVNGFPTGKVLFKVKVIFVLYLL